MPGDRTGATALDIDTTLAGRAYRRLEILPAETEPPRLWLPLLDGVERLGVLAAEVASVTDLYDPGLRTQCRWAASLIGHLVVAMTNYGDGLDVVRRRLSRTVAGELIWSLLPPLTAGVDGFVVSGVVEPRHAVAGDAFDYALSEDTARLLIVDAVGHDLRSGLLAATTVAAYRAVRHAGGGLDEQARLLDETLGGTFGDAAYVTAVLAEVDLRSTVVIMLTAPRMVPRPVMIRPAIQRSPPMPGEWMALDRGV